MMDGGDGPSISGGYEINRKSVSIHTYGALEDVAALRAYVDVEGWW